MTQKMTQQQRIIDYCETHGCITVRDAFEKLHINSPTKRISEIKKSGLYAVDTEEIRQTNSAGQKVRFTVYHIRRLGNA